MKEISQTKHPTANMEIIQPNGSKTIKVIDLKDCARVDSQGFSRISIFNPENTQESQLSLEYVILPTGEESSPHAHIGTHTVVYTIQGSVRLYYGNCLENQVLVKPQGCVYIPPNIIHYVVNEHREDMIAVVARTPYRHLVKEYAELVSMISPKLK